jgi:hypothetical protein
MILNLSDEEVYNLKFRIKKTAFSNYISPQRCTY